MVSNAKKLLHVILVFITGSGIIISTGMILALHFSFPEEVVKTEPESQAVNEQLPPGEWNDITLRSYPIHSDNSELTKISLGRVDEETWKQITDESALKLGVPPEMFDAPIRSDESYWGKSYPFSFPYLNDYIPKSWDSEFIKHHTVEILDLTSLLLLRPSATREGYEGSGKGYGFLQSGYHYSAYVLLSHAVKQYPSCNLQLQLTWLALQTGYNSISATETAIKDAIDLCPGVPDPLWMGGQAHGRYALFEHQEEMEDSSKNHMEHSLNWFRRLSAEYPKIPLGHLGEAELLLERSRTSSRRFEARNWRKKALKMLQEARMWSNDPLLALAQARGLTDSGEYGDAITLLQSFPNIMQSTIPLIHLKAINAMHLGRHAEVLSILNKAVVQPIAHQNFTIWGSGTLNISHYEFTHWGDYGGGLVGDQPYIPKDRRKAQEDVVTITDLGRAASFISDIPVGKAFSWCPPKNLSQDCATSIFETSPNSFKTENMQNILRALGKHKEAVRLMRNELNTQARNYWFYQMLGEASYHAGDFEEALNYFERALTLLPKNAGSQDNDGISHRVSLVLAKATCLRHLGRVEETINLLKKTLQYQENHPNLISIGTTTVDIFYLRSELGLVSLTQERYAESASYLKAAVLQGNDSNATALKGACGEAWRNRYKSRLDPSGDAREDLMRGAQENNLALAMIHQYRDKIEAMDNATSTDLKNYLGSGREELAKEISKAAKLAVCHDRDNPVYLNTLAYAQDITGEDRDEVISRYRDVLKLDATLFDVANNLGVLLAKNGDFSEAKKTFLHALSVKPDYATAMHNMAVLHSKQIDGFAPMLRWAGMAGRADSDYRTQELVFIVDDNIYDPNLDVSGTVNASWKYGDSAFQIKSTTIFIAIFSLAGQLSLIALSDKVQGRISSRVSKDRKDVRSIGISLSIVVSFLVCTWPLSFWSHSIVPAAAMGYFSACCIYFPLAAQSIVTPKILSGSSFVSAVSFGLLFAQPVFALAPYPKVEARGSACPRFLFWCAPIYLSIFSLTFMLLAVFTASPLARFLGLACVTALGGIVIPNIFSQSFNADDIKCRWLVVFVSTTASALQWIGLL